MVVFVNVRDISGPGLAAPQIEFATVWEDRSELRQIEPARRHRLQSALGLAL
jgi:hypothetical protein